MAKKILLFCLITFTGRTLQPSFKFPFAHVRAGKKRVLIRKIESVNCKFELDKNVLGFKSYSCFKKAKQNKFMKGKLKIVFYASKKRKPQKKNPVAFLLIPLKNWGTLYFL